MHERILRFSKRADALPRVLSSALLALLPACGFVGFDGQPIPDAGADTPAPLPEMDSGNMVATDDASARDAAPSMDATMVPDTGATEDAAPDAFVDPDPPATQVSDYCQSVPRLQRAPVIDGVVDSHLNVVTLTPLGWAGYGSSAPNHTTASYALAWLPDGLYAYVRVVDPNRLPPVSQNIWEGDGVELYFDTDGLLPAAPKYDDPGTIQIIVAAPEDDTTPSTKATRFRDGANKGAWMSTRFAAFPTADGYVLEGLIEADAVDVASLLLQAGNAVGVDLSINVSALDSQLDPDAGVPLAGRRLGQYFLSVTQSNQCGGLPFCNSAAFCAPTLVE